MGDDQSIKGEYIMNQHRENLLKLIKMMNAIKEENYLSNKTQYEFSLTDYEFTCYISDDRLISIRELTRMFLDKLNSEYLQCADGDEIVKFIEDMIEWLQSAYNFIIDNKAGSSSVKSLKICSQSLNDYKDVYEKAQLIPCHEPNKNIIQIKNSNGDFIFGRKEKEYKLSTQPMTINITFTGDEKSNQLSVEKLKDMIDKWSKNTRTFR